MPLRRRQRPATHHQRASTTAFSSSTSSSDNEAERVLAPQQHQQPDGEGDAPLETEAERDFRPPTSHAVSTPMSSRREIAPSGRRSTRYAAAAAAAAAEEDDRIAAAGGEHDWPPPYERQPQEYGYYGSSPYASQQPPPLPPQIQNQPAPASHIRSRMSGQPPPREFHPDVSFGTDLDYLPPVNDEIGPDVAETFNLGSFGEDSPPRSDGDGGRPHHHRRTTPRGSPQRYQPPPQHHHQQQHPPPPHHLQHPGYSPYASAAPTRGAPPGSRASPYAPAPSAYPPYYPPSHQGTSPPMYGPPDHTSQLPPQSGALPYATAAAAYPPYYYYPPPQYAHPMHHHPPPLQQHHGDAPWLSPDAYHAPSQMGAPPSVAAQQQPPPPPSHDDDDDLTASSPPHKKKRRERISGVAASPLPRRGELVGTTPEKLKEADDDLKMEEDEQGRLMIRSPFRSPDPSSATKYKQFFHSSPPAIGNLGSFGMTPGGLNVDEFSPMGQHTPFGTNSSIDEPLPLGAGDFGRLPLARSEDDEQDEQHDPREQEQQQQQPSQPPMLSQRRLSSSGFVRDFSPLGGGLQVSRSPLRSERRSREQGSDYSSGLLSPPRPESRASLRPSTAAPMSTRLIASPLGPAGSTAKPRKLWHDSSAPTPGPVRLELGDVGVPSQRRRTLEDINSMLRASTGHPPSGGPPAESHPYSASRTSALPPSRSTLSPPSSYREATTTPSKRAPSSQGTPGTTGRLSASRPPAPPQPYPQPPPSSVTKPSPGTSYASLAPRSTSSMAGSTPGTSKPPPSTGKENTGNATPATASKRKPCNCKKSKCLKLYCECFAAELYCEGCNCSECHNIAAYEPSRTKAIKDIRSKNPNAFKPRISVKPSPVEGPSPHSGHNMGCRCKRSECLKKYCECFQAGVICGNKCKCVDCLNYAGSQALIDKRRKIKDHRGADFAMRVADEAWKGKSGTPRNPSLPAVRGMGPSPPGSGRMPHSLPPPMMQRPSPAGSRGPTPHPHSGYMPHHMMMGPPHGMGYPTMGMPTVTPGYPGSMQPPQMSQPHEAYRAPMPSRHLPPPRAPPPPPPPPSVAMATGTSAAAAPGVLQPPHVTPSAAATPRTPGIRLGFDASKRRSKITLPEPTLDYFGSSVPEQPKTTALAIFSFLPNDDLYNAGLVCKRWSRLAMDEELWQFQA